MVGFDEFTAGQKSEDLEECLSVLEGIPVSSMNLLHWIIVAKRDDMYFYVAENFFKSGSKTDTTDPSLQQNLDSVYISIEPHVLARCLRGEQGAKYSVIHFMDKKEGQGGVAQTDVFTLQFKGAGGDDSEVEFSDEITDSRALCHQIKIESLGLVLIILSRNQKVLKHLIKEYPTIFMKGDEILNAALLCALKQWTFGIKILQSQLEIQFSKLSLIDRLIYVLKLFAIAKHYKNAAIQSSCEIILGLQKVRSFIGWLSKPDKANQNYHHILFESMCMQMFLPENVEIMKKGGEDDELEQMLEELEELMKL